MKDVELLAPVGNKEALIGAINAGANAVYLAGKKFGARAFSNNFEEENLIDAIRYAHLRGVFVYVTVNTLIFDDEIEDLLKFTDVLVENHVDALIVQDLGMIDLMIRRYPMTDIHASTQMNIHNIKQVKFLKKLGVKRIVMARETPLSIIKQIKKNIDIELEVFVHGALCVSYSGNCLMSSMLGGRSGNRGECAQPCRLAYRLYKDNQMISNQSYLLSTKDLMTIEYIDQLIEAGVDSFKIEGRMRKAEYVVQTILSYRKAINDYYNEKRTKFSLEIDKLKRVFNREYTKGYVLDEEPNEINNQFRPNHLGVPVGTVINYQNNKATIQLTDMLSVNDGFRIIGESDYGSLVSRILIGNKVFDKAEAMDIIQLDIPENVSKGSIVVKTLDHNLEENLSVYLDENFKSIGLKAIASAYHGKSFILEIIDGENHLSVKSSFVLEKAEQAPVTEIQIIEQLSKLGNTPFYFISLVVHTDNQSFMPIRLLNEMRREALNRVMIARLERKQKDIITNLDFGISYFDDSEFQYIVKVTTQNQLSAALKKQIKTIYYEDVMEIDEDLKGQLIPIKKRIQLHPQQNTDQLSVINEVGSLFDSEFPVIANEFLNVTNIYTAHLLSKHHAERVALSPEISRKNVLAFADRYYQKFKKYPNLEMVVYGRIDLMISKYCPIANTYKTRSNCNLCELNQYYLQDRLGQKMPLINDGNCNLRILNSKPLFLLQHLKEIKEAGIKNLRLDFTVEDYEEAIQMIKMYENALKNDKIIMNSKTYTTGRYLG